MKITIATISITEIQTILNEDINLIFDALVIGDYIKDKEEERDYPHATTRMIISQQYLTTKNCVR